MAEKTRILVLGATGYIGGSIVTKLLKEKKESYAISALVRKQEQVDKLKEVGVGGIIFKSLDDADAIRNAAKEYDIIIGAASARHAGSAQACIGGLADRKKASGDEVHYIHISGTSMIGDWPESGERIDKSIHSDIDEDIYATERAFPEKQSPTYIVPAPLIYGRGTGLFTEGVGQVHMMAQLALKKKQAVQIGSGSGLWNRIHILDLTSLFHLLISHITTKQSIPYGKIGYYFAENGFQSWASIAEGIGKTGYELGVFESSTVGRISLQEVADVFFGGDVRDAEGVLASNSRTKADRARQVLGWKPKYGEEAFDQEIKDVVNIESKEARASHTFR